MEEYYISFDESVNYFDKIHLYHKDFFSKEQIEEIIKEVYIKSLVEAPKVVEENMFKHYLSYKLREDYGFFYSNPKEKYNYRFDLDEIIKIND
ncbi:hypothetical protein CHH83_02270 [Bacillus sp. 7586-K]|nr:hypothetical protein CHH83_02270 [Bacillus sp. 7586-K]